MYFSCCVRVCMLISTFLFHSSFHLSRALQKFLFGSYNWFQAFHLTTFFNGNISPIHQFDPYLVSVHIFNLLR